MVGVDLAMSAWVGGSYLSAPYRTLGERIHEAPLTLTLIYFPSVFHILIHSAVTQSAPHKRGRYVRGLCTMASFVAGALTSCCVDTLA